MILKQLGLHLELTDEGFVHRSSRKTHRLVRYDAIDRVDFVEPGRLRLGRLRLRLVGDDTAADLLGDDENRFDVAGGPPKDRERLREFVQLLIAQVERAHPDRDRRDQTDPAAPAASPSAGLARSEQPPGEAVAPPTRAERRSTEKAEEQRSYEQTRDRLLQQAKESAGVADVVKEQTAIELLLRVARKHGGRKEVLLMEERVADLRRGGELISTRLLGTVEGEGVFDRLDRTDRLSQLFTVKSPPLQVYTDRVVQASVCHAIDEHTRADVTVDGEQQKISNRHLREKRNVDDRRRAAFRVAGSGWSMQVVVHPDRLDRPRGLAAQIEGIVSGLRAEAQRSTTYSVRSAPAPQPAPTGAPDMVGQLERLQALLHSGAITEEEFTRLKSALLAAAV